MADHPTDSRPPADPASRVALDLTDPAAVERLARELGTTTDALQGAIRAVGPRVDRIKDYLTGGMAGSQQDA